MTTQARIGWGTEFHLNDGTALVEISEVYGIGLPDPTTDTVEATHFKSEGAVREYIAGLIEAGEGEVEMNLVPGSVSDTITRAAQASRETRAYKFVIPAATGVWTASGNCIVTNVGRAIPIDDRMMSTVALKFTGLATETGE